MAEGFDRSDSGGDRFAQFTPAATQVMAQAAHAAQRLRQAQINAEHILLGLLDLPQERGAHLLAGL
ncbi:MAG TPA: Clp protease N-terminal domain-containing protein, partial [Chloroflexia bacterium]|nr:Clp protease N-terminal domain-containing protein [Chloroflexia bacterium]